MFNANPLVLSALNTVAGFKNIFSSFPSDFTALPCVSYYEAANSPSCSADDAEYLSEISVIIDLWGEAMSDMEVLAAETDTAMKKAGFIREFANDIIDPQSAVKQKTMKYKIIK